jgi:hypothetical protein
MEVQSLTSRVTVCAVLLFVTLASVSARADDMPAEVDYLLTAMGSCDCTFFRNGKSYSASEAEAHLRMKYKRGRRFAATTEDFIENLASRSSISKDPYYISCHTGEMIESGTWLMRLLAERRSQ